jgi:5-methylcytosine-specific restriction endonuclease McrA
MGDKDTKRCATCKIETPLELMGKNRSSKDGYNIYCKLCIRKASQKYRDSDIGRNRKSQARYRLKNKEKINQRSLNRYYAQKERFLKLQSERRIANYEAILETERASRARNADKNRQKKHELQKRRSLIIKESGCLILKKEIKALYSNPCYNCGTTKNQSIDHIIPLTRGGRNSIGNLMTLCNRCNSSKGAKTLMEWRVYRMKMERD